MTIGIDISSIIYQRGVSRYTSNLVRALIENGSVDLDLLGYSYRQNQYLRALANQFVPNQDSSSNHQLHLKKIPPQLMSKFWQFGLMPVRKLLPRTEVFHSWDWIQPPDKDLPLVSTIHDLSIIKNPETAHQDILAKHQKSWQILKERQAQIIAISRAVKKDIVNLLGYPSFLVSVIHEALPEEFIAFNRTLGETASDQIKNRLGLDKPYILFVGTREPRKNLARLIEAWQPLANDFQLIVAGQEGWGESSDSNNDVSNLKPRYLGKVSDQELAVLYSEAELFAYPSIDEGFGLPILEAFHFGTPVVTSNNSGMMEVAGDAAELVDPESVADINRGITKVITENLDQQKKRLQRMIIRQHMFSWQNVAEETLVVYQKALESKNV